ncbi:RHS repeat domain-containing protein [Xanthovirga aplysinae]|uniref:RHS repeat domain-containing protein n=1 Tax=Xanthovirga aplysinae TaxID=2529853 RepID=UPI001656F16B|nr:hypothetical protein [Xanthovirga aplysinae]
MMHETYAEGKALYFHFYIADKKEVVQNRIRIMKVKQLSYKSPNQSNLREIEFEYAFDRFGNVLKVVMFNDLYLPADLRGQRLFYSKDLYKYNEHHDLVEHQKFSMGKDKAEVLENTHYLYDSEGRILKAETINFADPSDCSVEFFEYDKNGKLIHYKTDYGFEAAYSYDENGKLRKQLFRTEIDRVSQKFFYDSRGNMIEFQKQGKQMKEREEVRNYRTFDDHHRVVKYKSEKRNGEEEICHFFYSPEGKIQRKEFFQNDMKLSKVEYYKIGNQGLISSILSKSAQGDKISEESISYQHYATTNS